jgi:hypothetical protein
MHPHTTPEPSVDTSQAAGTTQLPPEALYRERAAQFAQLRDEARRRSYRAGNLTVGSFAGAFICGVAGGVGGSRALLVIAAGMIILAIAMFVRQGPLDAQYRRYRELCAITEEGPHRLARAWDALPLRQPSEGTPYSPLANDLDLLGRASLQHLLSSANTGAGQAALQCWLLEPAAPDIIRLRQAAVRELAPQVEVREELAVDGRLMTEAQASYLRFLEWAEGTPWLRARDWLVWLTRALTALTLVFILLSVLGLTRYPLWLLAVMLNVLVTAVYGKRVDAILNAVAERQQAFAPYAEVYSLLMSQPFKAQALRDVQARLGGDGPRADAEMRRLGRIMRYAELRRSMFFAVIQALLLWTFHVAWFVEGWQTVSGQSARRWLLALGEADALAALATLAFDHPDWCFPDVREEDAPQLVASALGHPLLLPSVCMRNDVMLGPPGTLLLVTGSNMSGKSTLLRALGTNIVLAQAGGPVCATALTMPPLRLATSIRIGDSLEQGVSYFLAELRRLKEIVDAAEGSHDSGGPVVCYLLDEILHGTNTGERQIAARRILTHLLAEGAIGAVSTHDLTLADTPEITAAAQQVHFTETFTRGPEGPSMSFDYKLRPGLATSTNALKLMEIVGLDV